MAEENKTALEWLWEQIPFEYTSSRAAFDVYQQAKELEEKQIIKAHLHGVIHHFDNPNNASEEYFSQTYGGDNE